MLSWDVSSLINIYVHAHIQLKQKEKNQYNLWNWNNDGKPILIKYQSSSQFSDIPIRARGGCLVQWRFLSTSENFLYEGISAGLSPERMKLNPNKTLRKDQWKKKSSICKCSWARLAVIKAPGQKYPASGWNEIVLDIVLKCVSLR